MMSGDGDGVGATLPLVFWLRFFSHTRKVTTAAVAASSPPAQLPMMSSIDEGPPPPSADPLSFCVSLKFGDVLFPPLCVCACVCFLRLWCVCDKK